jgi:hypothetical protein
MGVKNDVKMTVAYLYQAMPLGASRQIPTEHANRILLTK